MPFLCPSRKPPSTASSPVTSTAISRRENDDASLQRPDGWRRSSSWSPPFAVRVTRRSAGRSVNSRTARTGGGTSGCSRARILRRSSAASFCSRAAGSSSHALDAPAFVLPLSGLAATRPSRLPRLCRSRLSARVLAGRERAPRPAGVHVRAGAGRRRGRRAPPVARSRRQNASSLARAGRGRLLPDVLLRLGDALLSRAGAVRSRRSDADASRARALLLLARVGTEA